MVDGAFVCPCHGSQFDLAGRVLNGPADVPLFRFRTTHVDGELAIRL
jgi:Rieske Fe-S protein